jgi:hypothetical protein
MTLQEIFENVLDRLTGGGARRDETAAEDVRPASEDPYGDPADQLPGQPVYYSGDVLPASQDPYGDPAETRHPTGDVLHASQDPHGDPANAGVPPASRDPYGDPADQEPAGWGGRRR